MDQILRSNEINFAVLAALPAVLVSIAIFALARQYALYQVCRKGGVNRTYLTENKRISAHFGYVTD